jgi:hypothetical protein
LARGQRPGAREPERRISNLEEEVMFRNQVAERQPVLSGRRGGDRLWQLALAVVVLAVLLLPAGCRKARTSMDVRPEARQFRGTIPATGPLEVTYIWSVSESFTPVEKDYAVFIHFWGEDDELQWQDDHHPPVPTSRWQPGQTIEYTRIHFLPRDVPQEEVILTMGLYDALGTGDKVRLEGRQTRRLEYEACRFEVIPADQLPEIIYEDGWYNREFVPGKPDGAVWRWSRQEAFCKLENPRRAAALYLEAQAPVELIGEAQLVTIEIEGEQLTSFEVAETERFLRKFPLPDHILGDQQFLSMTIRAGKAVVPSEIDGSGDERQLGLKVFNMSLF